MFFKQFNAFCTRIYSIMHNNTKQTHMKTPYVIGVPKGIRKPNSSIFPNHQRPSRTTKANENQKLIHLILCQPSCLWWSFIASRGPNLAPKRCRTEIYFILNFAYKLEA